MQEGHIVIGLKEVRVAISTLVPSPLQSFIWYFCLTYHPEK